MLDITSSISSVVLTELCSITSLMPATSSLVVANSLGLIVISPPPTTEVSGRLQKPLSENHAP